MKHGDRELESARGLFEILRRLWVIEGAYKAIFLMLISIGPPIHAMPNKSS